MLRDSPTGFERKRKDSPYSWTKKADFGIYPRYQHEVSGLVVSGNNRPRNVSVSVSRLLHGLNVFPVSESQLNQGDAALKNLVSQVVENPFFADLTYLEIFVHVPIPFSFFRQFEGVANTRFQGLNEDVWEHSLYCYNSKSPGSSTRTLVFYDKPFELRQRQGISWLRQREAGWKGFTRIELRLKNPALSAMLREFDTLSLSNLLLSQCYHAVRSHALGFAGSEFLREWLPDTYEQFQKQVSERRRYEHRN